MGRIAAELADIAIVTDDNPRSENPETIRKAIRAGAAKDIEEIAGRREAIRRAVELMQAGDVLVLAGKGHEQGQIFADHVEPFDDVEEAKHAMKDLKGAA
jgi:UDP-N-acetylmuramoyl-L-alanyl-D-glutamate--2,6-diaminopimelate ligase